MQSVLRWLEDRSVWFELGVPEGRVDRDTRRRIRLLSIATLAMCLVGIPSAERYAALGFTAIGVAHLAAILVAVGNLALLRRTLRPDPHAHVALAILTTLLVLGSWVSGGFSDPSFGWIYVVPLGAAVVLGLGGAWGWTGVILAVAVGFWSLPQLGFEIANQSPEEARAAQQLFDRSSAIVAVALMASSFVVGERRAARELALANEELRREGAYVQLLEHAAVSANEAIHFEPALHDGVQRICDAMGWPVGHVYLLGDDGRLRSSGSVHRLDPIELRTLEAVSQESSFGPGEGLPGRALESGRPVMTADLSASDSERARLACAVGIRAGLTVPVPVNGRVEAVLEFGCRDPLPADDHLLDVLGHVGLQLGRVAERAALQDILRQAQKMEAVGQLAAGIAHEINNPMAFVRSNLLQHCEQSDSFARLLPESREILEECIQGVDRTIAIVRDVRDFSRIGRREREHVSWAAEIEGAVRVAKAQAPPDVHLVWTAADEADAPALEGSSNQIRQVLVNLIVNAIQAVGDAGEVRIDAKVEAQELVIRVQDDGPGIAPEHRDRLFEPFFTTKPVGAGTGLGLYVSYEIVQAHGGDLRLESELGVGSVFEVRLPLGVS